MYSRAAEAGRTVDAVAINAGIGVSGPFAETSLGASSKDDPAKVANEGFEALMRGKDHVVAGSLKNKLMAGAAKILPEATKAQAHRRMSEPGSAED